METWLRPNVRALAFGSVLPALVGLAGLALVVGLPGRPPAVWMRVVGAILAVLGGGTVLVLVRQLRQPRLAYFQNHLLVALRSGAPLRVPIEVVECFWLGQAESLLPTKRHERTETSAVVIRLAESATEWRQREVKPQLGKWCEGYITIRGTWCEPLNIELINRLNERLAEVTRQTADRETAP
ncbi:MAG TPA: hypothetical protein VGZ26_02195 [Pirellulales bacterium]|jgi:hypothetical protein|nr:hypothetical protein [Pirellulales bacterium]